MRRSKVGLVLAVMVCAGLLVTGSAVGAKKQIKIGVVSPLTGDVATFGQSVRNGVVMATEEFNAAGGVLDSDIVLVIEDDKNDPTETANIVQKFVTQDKVVAIIGSVASKCTLAGAPIAQAAKIPMLTPTSTNIKVTQVGDYIFRACFIDPFQGSVMAKFVYNTLKKKTAAVLTDIANDYTKGLAEAFDASFKKLGGKVVAYESYTHGDTDFSAQLTKIKAAKPDVLYLPDYYDTVGLIARQARQMGITIPCLGGDGWDSSDLTKIAGDALEGCYFTNHYSSEDKSPMVVEFVKNYKARFGSEPDALAALAYDASLVLFTCIGEAGKAEPKAIRDALANTKGVKAVSGLIKFDENRNPIKNIVILQVVGDRFKYIEKISP